MLIATITLALALFGLLAAPTAQAATVVSGTGAETSVSVKLDAGIYRVELAYTDNVADSGATTFNADLADASGSLTQPLARDLAVEGTQRRIIELSKAGTVWVEVQVAAVGATWHVTFQKLAEPTATVSTLTVNGTGTNTDTLYRLKAGTYLATVTYQDNQSDDQGDFALSLIGRGGAKQRLIQSDAGTDSRSSNVSIASTGTVWLNVSATPNARWTLTLTPAAKLGTTPTPTISGSAKVGRTLTAKAGTWKPSGVQLVYRWKRSGKSISGATASTYRLTSSDKGKKITVTVTGSKLGYVSVAKTSKATAKVGK